MKFDPVHRVRLFYNQFQYSVCCKFVGAHFLRQLSHQSLDTRIDRRNATCDRYCSPNGVSYLERASENTRANLHQVLDVLLDCGVDYRTSVTGDWMYLYTNDTSVCESLDELSFVTINSGQQCTVTPVPSNSILLRRSRYSYRTYFRPKLLSDEDKSALMSFIDAQGSEIRLSPKFTKWAQDGWSNRLWPGFFVDHNDPDSRVMIEMMAPGSSKLTVSIIHDK